MDAPAPKVAADPATTELFGHSQRCAGAAEEVGYQIPFPSARPNDSGQKRLGLLGRVPKSLVLRKLRNVVPYRLRRDALCGVEILLILRNVCFRDHDRVRTHGFVYLALTPSPKLS